MDIADIRGWVPQCHPLFCSTFFDLICCCDEICVILYEMDSFLFKLSMVWRRLGL